MMKNIEVNYPILSVQTTMFLGSNDINVRDKNDMRRRLHSTQLIAPGHITIEAWDINDESKTIWYESAESLFGPILIASTLKGVCYVGFDSSNRITAYDDLKRRFPQNALVEKTAPFHDAVIKMMNDPQLDLPLQFHLKGTKFQLDIWKKLAEIPLGGFTTYGQIGGSSKNARATGTAVGSNPISFLLPCHRVIHADGGFNGYFWGPELKEKLLVWEAKKMIP